MPAVLLRLEADWRTRAACRDADPRLWDRDPNHRDRDQQAKAVCARCLVQDACLDYAVVANEPGGIFGGLDEEERRPLRRSYERRQRAAREQAARDAKYVSKYARAPRRKAS